MQESDIRVVRGVSIASIVLAVLAILGCIAAMALSAGLGVVASDPSNFDGYVEYRDDLGATNGIDAQYDMSPEETSALVTLAFGFISAFSGIGVVLCVISLIAGIVGVRNCRNPQKVGKIFGWSIAGAICAVLMGRVISCVLLIVNAVYANRLKKAAANPAMYAQPVYGYAPQGYAQPVAQQPMPQQPMNGVTPAQQPVAPAQPVQSQQPVAPAQPAAPQQPQEPKNL
jgi:hypothetical protein